MRLFDKWRIDLGLCLGLLRVYAGRRVFGFERGHLLTVVLVERHVIIANKVVSFLTC